MDFIGDALPPGTLSFDVVLDAFVGEGRIGAVVHTVRQMLTAVSTQSRALNWSATTR